MLRSLLALAAAIVATPQAIAAPPVRVAVADETDAMFRSVALGKIDAPFGRGDIRDDVRTWLMKADFFGAHPDKARYELKVKIIEKSPARGLPFFDREGAELESQFTLMERGKDRTVASARADGIGKDAIRQGFAALVLDLAAKNMVRVRDAATCAELNPNGLNGAYLTRTATKVGVDCPR
jgi:hypothetical protein